MRSLMYGNLPDVVADVGREPMPDEESYVGDPTS